MLDLDALVNPAKLPRVRLFGREVAVHPLTGEGARRIAAAQAVTDNGEAMLGALLDVVRASLPSVTAEEVATLTVEQIAAVVTVARGGVDEVERQLAAQAEKN
jgi:hypothetical protein